MIQNNISFQQVEKSEFQYLLHYLLACSSSVTALYNFLPESGNTIRCWIINLFESSKLFIKNNLISSNRMIHFSFNLWSSPNNQAFLGIVSYWVDQNGCLQTALLGLKRFRGAYTGENQAEHFLEIICSWDILFQIGYFVLDNASNNDTAVFYIAKYLSSLNISFNATSCHL